MIKLVLLIIRYLNKQREYQGIKETLEEFSIIGIECKEQDIKDLLDLKPYPLFYKLAIKKYRNRMVKNSPNNLLKL